MFPLMLRQSLAASDGPLPGARTNLSTPAIAYLSDMGVAQDDLFFHALAMLHSPAYRTENGGALRQDWPRVPLPASAEVLKASATLGRQMAALLDVEQAVEGVTTGIVRPELRGLGAASRVGAGAIDPATDLALTASWGRGGNGKPVMPGRGRAIERPMSHEERAAITSAINPLGLVLSTPAAPLGESTFDIYLNDRVCWRNVPARVWDYTLGGYQVLKKWLSYREAPILGRPLRVDEARLFREIVRRIAAILLLDGALDANYAQATRETWDWQAAAAENDPARGWQTAMPGFMPPR